MNRDWITFASGYATSHGYTFSRPSKRGPTSPAHPHRCPRDHWPQNWSFCMEESQWLRKMRWHGILMQSCLLFVIPTAISTQWSSTHTDTILEIAAQGQIEKAWTQIADALHQMVRAQLQRSTSTVPAEIKDATVRRREALRPHNLAVRRWR